MLNCLLAYCPFYQDESLALSHCICDYKATECHFLCYLVIFPNLSVYIKLTEWHMFNFLVFLISSYFKAEWGGGVIWADGLHVHVRTYHVPELVHPESVAVMTIVSLHVVFSDFINIFKPNQLPENTCICQINWKTTGRIGSCIFQMGSIYDRRLNIISWIE